MATKSEKPQSKAAKLAGKVVREPRLASLQDRRARNREQMVATILDCARDIMQAEGVQALSMHTLAKAVGIQPPSLYEYFDSRNAIFDAVYRHGLLLFQENMFKSLKKAKDFPDVVRLLFKAELGFSRKHPDLYQIIFNNALPGYVISDENRKQVRAGLDRGISFMTERLNADGAHPLIAAEDAALLVDVVISGVSTRLLNLGDPASAGSRKQYENLIESLIKLLTQRS